MNNKDVIAFNCSKCHEHVARYTENDFEQLYKKGLCKKCLKNLKNNSVSDVKSCYNKYCDYNCDGECKMLIDVTKCFWHESSPDIKHIQDGFKDVQIKSYERMWEILKAWLKHNRDFIKTNNDKNYYRFEMLEEVLDKIKELEEKRNKGIKESFKGRRNILKN